MYLEGGRKRLYIYIIISHGRYRLYIFHLVGGLERLFFIFFPYIGNNNPSDFHIFQRGWPPTSHVFCPSHLHGVSAEVETVLVEVAHFEATVLTVRVRSPVKWWMQQWVYLGIDQGLVNVPFWGFWVNPLQISLGKKIPQYLGDVQLGHLPTPGLTENEGGDFSWVFSPWECHGVFHGMIMGFSWDLWWDDGCYHMGWSHLLLSGWW